MYPWPESRVVLFLNGGVGEPTHLHGILDPIVDEVHHVLAEVDTREVGRHASLQRRDEDVLHLAAFHVRLHHPAAQHHHVVGQSAGLLGRARFACTATTSCLVLLQG